MFQIALKSAITVAALVLPASLFFPQSVLAKAVQFTLVNQTNCPLLDVDILPLKQKNWEENILGINDTHDVAQADDDPSGEERVGDDDPSGEERVGDDDPGGEERVGDDDPSGEERVDEGGGGEE